MKNFIKKAGILLLALAFCVSAAVPCLAAGDEKSAQNNPATKKSTEVVRVGYYLSDGYQEYDEETGIYSGYSYEFLMALQQYTNWKYEFVQCSFGDGLKMLENGEIDLMNNVSKTAEREDIYDFSNMDAGENIAYVAMKAGDTRVAMNDLAAIENIKIALAKDSIYSDRLVAHLTANHVDANILWFDNREGAEQAFESGEADAYIVTSSTITNEHIILRFSPDSYYLATTKGNEELIGEVNDAIESLRANDPSFELRLHNKYYGQATEDYTVLTQSEREYLEANPVTRVLYQPDWYPISYQNKDGEFDGAIRGVYDLLEQRTGMKFEFVPYDANNDSESITEGYNCLMMAEQPTDFSGSGLYDVKLTKSFITPSLTEISNHVLSQGDTLVLVDGDYLSDLAQHIYKDKVSYIFVDSVEECLSAVKNKKADGTVLITYESEFYRQQRQYRELTYTIVDTGSYGFSMAVSNEADPRLYTIISKGLNSISEGEISNVFNNTLQSLQKTDFLTLVADNPVPVLFILALFVALATGTITGWFFIRKLNEKNADLAKAAEVENKANMATKQFLARMSHDMRTPMNGILGLSYIMEDQICEPEVLHELHQLRDSGDYLLQLINDVLDINKVTSGNLNLQPKICNEKLVFDSIIALVEPPMKEKNITFSFEKINIDWKWMVLDAQRVKQIFINLLSNATKFTPEGGRIDFVMELISETETMIKDKFVIRDTGIGMSSEFMPHAFEPFEQENKIHENLGGTGLGLSIVKNLVEQMGGSITVESEEGLGTTFTLYLNFPLAEKPKEMAKEMPQAENENTLKDVHILLCEDHPLNAQIATRLLEKKGASVTVAENGKVGVEKFSQSAVGYFRIILMDIRMPEMDGLGATRAIRLLDRPDAKEVPIIAMTANAYDADIQESLDAGMNAHLAKPINPKELYETIEKELL